MCCRHRLTALAGNNVRSRRVLFPSLAVLKNGIAKLVFYIRNNKNDIVTTLICYGSRVPRSQIAVGQPAMLSIRGRSPVHTGAVWERRMWLPR